jgi:hypothetical protein
MELALINFDEPTEIRESSRASRAASGDPAFPLHCVLRDEIWARRSRLVAAGLVAPAGAGIDCLADACSSEQLR